MYPLTCSSLRLLVLVCCDVVLDFYEQQFSIALISIAHYIKLGGLWDLLVKIVKNEAEEAYLEVKNSASWVVF